MLSLKKKPKAFQQIIKGFEKTISSYKLFNNIKIFRILNAFAVEIPNT